MTYDEYLKIEGCEHQYVIPSINTENVSVFCIKDVDMSDPKNVPPWKICPECIGKDCESRVWSKSYKTRLELGLSSKNITEDMESVTDATVHYWAFLHWRDELAYYRQTLEDAQDEEHIKYLCHCIVEAKKLIVELYNKLVQMPEFNQGLIDEPEWMEHFLRETDGFY